MKKKRRLLNVDIDRQLHETAKAQAKRNRCSVAAYIRGLILADARRSA